MKTIIDISHHNGNIDFAKVKASGVSGVIIQCGYGSDTPNQDDYRFKRNIEMAISNGLEVGVYLFSYATSTAQAESEAKHALRLCKPYAKQINNFIWYDVEESTQAGFARSAIRIFSNYLNANGFNTGIYSGLSYYLQNIDGVGDFPLWLASYGTDDGKPHTRPNIGECIWQYSSRGRIGGINGDVDVNFDYRSEDMTRAETEKICNDMIYKYIELAKKEIYKRLEDLEGAAVTLETLEAETPQKYQTLGDIPEWGKATVKKLIDNGSLIGTDKGLSLTEETLRVLVINDRNGLYDSKN